jgi:hypothetical protein
VRTALGRAVRVETSSPPDLPPVQLAAREAACLVVLPLQLLAVRRRAHSIAH